MNEKNITNEDLELNGRQVERIDEIHNAVMELCQTMCEDPDLEWDMAFIGEIADVAADILVGCGKTVCYPAIVTEKDGSQHVEEFHGAK